MRQMDKIENENFDSLWWNIHLVWTNMKHAKWHALSLIIIIIIIAKQL